MEDFSDLAIAIEDFAHDVTLITTAAGVIGASDGMWTDGAATEATIRAVSWPSSGREVDLLDAGERTKDTRTFATRTPVSEADAVAGRAANRIRENGREYKVMKLAPWTDGAFYIAICVRTGP